jgi:hypothetical protein
MEKGIMTNLNLGFLLDDLSPSQTTYSCIFNSNHYLAKNNNLTICLFFNEISYPCTYPLFPRFHSRDCIGFDGLLISTSVESSMFLKQNYRSQKVFYIQDLEWERSWGKNLNLDVLYEPDIIKVCRSEDHKNFIKKTKTPINLIDTIIDNFDILALSKLYTKKD